MKINFAACLQWLVFTQDGSEAAAARIQKVAAATTADTAY